MAHKINTVLLTNVQKFLETGATFRRVLKKLLFSKQQRSGIIQNSVIRRRVEILTSCSEWPIMLIILLLFGKYFLLCIILRNVDVKIFPHALLSFILCRFFAFSVYLRLDSPCSDLQRQEPSRTLHVFISDVTTL